MADTIKAVSDSTKHGMIIVNPDGSNVGGGVEYNATPPTLADGGTDAVQADANGNTKTTLATLIAGEDLNANVLKTEQRATYSNITVDTAVKSGSGRLFGWVVNSHTSGTLKVWDNTAASGTVIFNTITFASGPQMWIFPVAIEFTTGLYFDVGGTVDITALYK